MVDFRCWLAPILTLVLAVACEAPPASEPTPSAEEVLVVPPSAEPSEDPVAVIEGAGDPDTPPAAPSTGGEPYDIGGDVLPPTRLEGSSPTALLELMRSGHYGWGSCILSTVVTREGRIEEIELLQPDRVAPEVESALTETIQSWRFEPATRHGEPVAVRYYLTIFHCPFWPRGVDSSS